jgi:hypothetical protein
MPAWTGECVLDMDRITPARKLPTRPGSKAVGAKSRTTRKTGFSVKAESPNLSVDAPIRPVHNASTSETSRRGTKGVHDQDFGAVLKKWHAVARVGDIDIRAQAEVPSMRRSDTPSSAVAASERLSASARERLYDRLTLGEQIVDHQRDPNEMALDEKNWREEGRKTEKDLRK